MAMKFIPLDGKKDPPSNFFVIISFKDESWTEAKLRRIEFNNAGDKKYVFGRGDDEWDDATHFMIVETPKVSS